MTNSYLKYSFLFLFLLFTVITVNAQKISGLNAGVEFGASRFVMEVPVDFSHKIIEFDNKFGFTVDAELAKYLSGHWEVGIDLNYTKLSGESYNHNFSALKYEALYFDADKPVEYDNRIFGPKVFTRFYVMSLTSGNSKTNMYPFFSAGVGLINYKSRFKYINPEDNSGDIFGKGTEDFPLKLSTAVYSLGAGLHASVSSDLFILVSMNYHFTGYDFLDAMHNYSAENVRIDVIGVYFDFKIGIFYNITPIKESASKKGRKGKSRGGSGNLPFAK